MLTKAALIVKEPQWLRRNNSSECKIEVNCWIRVVLCGIWSGNVELSRNRDINIQPSAKRWSSLFRI